MNKPVSKAYPFLLIGIIEVFFLALAWFVSDISQAARIDRFFLYYVDDIFRYCHVKTLPFNPAVILNYYCKPGYMLIAGLFHSLLPFGMLSLRIMNTIFSSAILFLVYKFMVLLSLPKKVHFLTLVLLASFPVYLILSVSVLSEVIYSFFIMLSLYLFCLKKYKLSVIFVSLLPLIRQEGLIYVFIWLFLTFKQLRLKYLVFLFIPAACWVLINKLFFGHPFIKFIFYLPTDFPVNSLALPSGFLSLLRLMGAHPLFLLSIIGLFAVSKDKPYRALRICFLAQIAFFIVLESAHFFKSGGLFCREIRILMPLAPLAVLFAAKGLSLLAKKYNFFIRFLLAAILIAITVFQLGRLQLLPESSQEYVSKNEEILIKDASGWLNSYIKKEAITRVCVVPGAEVTDKIIRRLWMYLPGQIAFYADGDESDSFLNNDVFDFIDLKVKKLPPNTAHIFISKNRLNFNTSEKYPKINLLKDYPEIPLYFYQAEYN